MAMSGREGDETNINTFRVDIPLKLFISMEKNIFFLENIL